ncbi:MAG: hypothetical protein DBY37_13460 [Desulfovibrionaceae bacterium]|nr:MAG: hypothetical protein DBY37_13460 [Desulfovibrionaceae bacterium]
MTERDILSLVTALLPQGKFFPFLKQTSWFAQTNICTPFCGITLSDMPDMASAVSNEHVRIQTTG